MIFLGSDGGSRWSARSPSCMRGGASYEIECIQNRHFGGKSRVMSCTKVARSSKLCGRLWPLTLDASCRAVVVSLHMLRKWYCPVAVSVAISAMAWRRRMASLQKISQARNRLRKLQSWQMHMTSFAPCPGVMIWYTLTLPVARHMQGIGDNEH